MMQSLIYIGESVVGQSAYLGSLKVQQQIALFSTCCWTTQGAKVSHDAKSHLHWESVIGQSDYFGPLGIVAKIVYFFYL
jgi:hypothetical protein